MLVVLGTSLLIAFGLALLASIVNLWPVVESGTEAATGGGTAAGAAGPKAAQTVRLMFAAVTLQLTPGTAYIVLVALVGALGASIHIGTSFSDFVGNRRFLASWAPWYLLRPVVGAALSLLLYFAVRGGFFSASSQSADVNPYGIAALAGLAGLFSKQATDKLREVFETLFHVSKGDAQRMDNLANEPPILTVIEPDHVAAGSKNVVITVHGEHFVKDASIVRLNRVPQATTFVSGHELSALLPDALVSASCSLEVTVFTGPPGGGESQPPLPLPVL